MGRTKYKVFDLIGIMQGLERVQEIKFPPTYAYALARLKRQITPEVAQFEERRVALFNGLAVTETDEDGKATGEVSVPAAKVPEFQDAINAELEVEIPVDLIKIDIIALQADYEKATGEGLVLDPIVMELLYPIIEFNDEEESDT